MDQTDKDMTWPQPAARWTVPPCPNPNVAIEFQGGEPTVNWPVIKFVTRYAKLKNEVSGRGLYLSLVTNMSLMDDERFDFLVREGVGVCTSLDGPAEVHDRNRIFTGGNSHAETVRWLKRFTDYVSPQGRRLFKPGALMTTTRLSLSHGDAIIDEYLRLGLPGIFLRPLSPIGFALRSWDKIGYTTKEYLAFTAACSTIIEVNPPAALHDACRGPF
jgi:sulfatase maturation enzyme AslB (radical SAM superfamily)